MMMDYRSFVLAVFFTCVASGCADEESSHGYSTYTFPSTPECEEMGGQCIYKEVCPHESNSTLENVCSSNADATCCLQKWSKADQQCADVGTCTETCPENLLIEDVSYCKRVGMNCCVLV